MDPAVIAGSVTVGKDQSKPSMLVMVVFSLDFWPVQLLLILPEDVWEDG